MPAGPTLTPLFSDNFQRANVSPLAAPWAIDENGDTGLAIVSDLCGDAGGANTTGVQLYEETLPNDQYVSATLGGPLQSGSSGFEISARTTDNGVQFTPGHWPGYALVVYGFFGTIGWNLFCSTGGLIASESGLTINSGDTFTLAIVGTTVYVLQNSTLLTSFSNSAVSSGGSALACISNGNGNSVQVSNFVVGSASSGYDPTKIFLGSVRVLGSAPAGRSNPFLGTVKVIASAPAGLTNPYLGSVVVGAPSGPQTDPSLGQVVEVASAPANDTDPFLGTVETS